MYIPKTPKIAQKVFPKLTWREKTAQNELFLTFDDGPTPEITTWVLDLLAEYNAKATFFCLGKNVEENPTLFERIKTEKHTVGNHTYNHLNAWQTSRQNYLDDIKRCEAVFQSDLFRPPYGKLRIGTRKEILKDYKIIMWDVMSYDFDKELDGENCCNNVIKNAKSGSIIVFHDSIKASHRLKKCLPKVLKHFTQEGFEFSALK